MCDALILIDKRQASLDSDEKLVYQAIASAGNKGK
jgi:hypothetical protein